MTSNATAKTPVHADCYAALFTETFSTLWWTLDPGGSREALSELWMYWLDSTAHVMPLCWQEKTPEVMLVWDSEEHKAKYAKRVEMILDGIHQCPDEIKMTVRHAIVSA